MTDDVKVYKRGSRWAVSLRHHGYWWEMPQRWRSEDAARSAGVAELERRLKTWMRRYSS